MIVIAITILLIITTIVPSKTVGFGSEVEVKKGWSGHRLTSSALCCETCCLVGGHSSTPSEA